MKKLLTTLLTLSVVLIGLGAGEALGQRRRVVIRRPHPLRRPLIVRPNHPFRRPLPKEVVVRTARKPVVVNAPLVYLPELTWTPVVAPLPPTERLIWQESETIARDEEWVDKSFGVDQSGNALFLDIGGQARLLFADVTFANGNVQVVNFNDRTYGSGIYRLLDFADGRHVSTVRILARSESSDTKLGVYLSK
ncbi:MAG TPA: hypothetical protein VFZ40_02940 [Pyrinomonadaceae bacterium]